MGATPRIGWAKIQRVSFYYSIRSKGRYNPLTTDTDTRVGPSFQSAGDVRIHSPLLEKPRILIKAPLIIIVGVLP